MKTMTDKEITVDADLYPDRPVANWEDIMRDVDALFHHLKAPLSTRKVVALRLQGSSVTEIAAQFGETEHAIRRHIALAHGLMVKAGALEAPHPLPAGKAGPLSGMSGRKGGRPGRGSKPHLGPEAAGGRSAKATVRATELAKRIQAARRDVTPPPTCPGERSLCPLTPVQSFGWRDVYYDEVHRYGIKG